MKTFNAVLFAGLSNAYGLAQLSRSNKNVASRKKAIRNKVLFAFLMVYLVAAFTMYVMAIGTYMDMQGYARALVPLSISAGMLMTFVLSTLRAPAAFFGCKDFDMLMSMPISAFTVFMSKLALVYVKMLLYTLMFSLPCAISYGLLASPSPLFYVLFFAAVLFAPLLPIAAGTLCGFVLSRIAVGTRFKNAAMIALSCLFMVGILVGNFAFSSAMSNPDAMAGSVGAIVKAAYLHPLAKVFEMGTAGINPLYTLLFAAANAAAAVLVGLTVGRNFLALNTRMNDRRRTASYKGGGEKAVGALRALVGKESRYYFSQAGYVMNTAVGGVMLLIGAVALFFAGDSLMADLSLMGVNLERTVFCVFMLAVIFCTGMTMTAASSISLEGNNLWVLQTIPVPAATVLYAKVIFNILVAAPLALLALAIASFAVQLSAPYIIMLAVTIVASSAFTAFIGLFANLHNPKLDWVNPVSVYKQGTAVLITMLFMFATCIIFGIAVFVLPFSALAVAGVLNAVYIAACALLALWMKKNAHKRMLMLSEM